MNTKKDFFEQDLAIDDLVLFGTTMSQGRGFEVGKIVRFTPKMVVVEVRNWRDIPGTKNVYSDDLYKVDEQLMTLYLLKRKSKL